MGLTDDIGRQGEDAAAEYLSSNGFSILERNWRYGRYELDIIAEKQGVLHFIEVKCRRAGGLTKPEDAINPSKFSSILRAANAYIQICRSDSEIQFDLIAVEHEADSFTVRYIPEAMQARW